MGQKVSSEYGIGVNTSKKEKFLTDVQETFDCCAEGRFDRLVELITENHNLVKCNGRKMRTPLHIAAQNGSLSCIAYLIEVGAPVDVVDYMNRTPLMYACIEGRSDAARLLLDFGSDIAACDKYNLTPLHFACDCKNSASDYSALVLLLLDWEASVDALCRWNRTPLMHASGAGSCDVVQVLLEQGANIEAKDTVGRNSLWKACTQGRFEVAELLVRNGAEFDPASKLMKDAFGCKKGEELDQIIDRLVILRTEYLDSHRA